MMEESIADESHLSENYLVVVNVEPVDVEMSGNVRNEGATGSECLDRSQNEEEDEEATSCDADDHADDQSMSVIENGSSRWEFKWTEKGTRLLLNLLMKSKEEFVDGKMKKKKMWATIAKQLSDAGFKCSDVQASNKWKLLVRSYRSAMSRMHAQKLFHKKSMPGIVERRYFKELSELIGTGISERRRVVPEIPPRSSGQRLEQQQQQQQAVVDNWNNLGSTTAAMASDHDNMAAPAPSVFESFRRKCSHDVLADLVQWIHDSEERQMQMIQKLHQEKMTFLKDLLQHMKGPGHGHHC